MFVIEDIKNSKWANAEHTSVECEVKFEGVDDYLPFGACVNGDQYAHTKEIFDRAASGEFGDVSEFVPIPEPLMPDQNQPTVDGAQTL